MGLPLCVSGIGHSHVDSPDVIRQNHPWADTWTAREAVLAAVSRLERIAAPFVQLKAVSEAAGILTKALHSRWPELGSVEDVLPQWTALKSLSKKG